MVPIVQTAQQSLGLHHFGDSAALVSTSGALLLNNYLSLSPLLPLFVP